MVKEVVLDEFLKYDRDAILAEGDERFKGTFNKEPVVVNRTFLNSIEVITKNKDVKLRELRHANIAHLLHVVTDPDFRYDALEPYAASLDSLFLRNGDCKKYDGPMPSNERVLLQLASGLSYLHSSNILHGDIKPENILISSTLPVKMKWTRFGFRQLSLNDFCSLTPSAPNLGSRKWWPPEMYKDKKKLSKKGEIFSVGCVFLYIFSGGVHPFAQDESGLKMNDSRGIPVTLKGPNNSDLSTTQFDFVKKMTYKNPENRMPLWDVIRRLKILLLPNISNSIGFPSLSYVMKTSSNGQYSFGLFLSKSESLAVKRIPIQYCSDNQFIVQLRRLNHSNIVCILDSHEDTSYKYFRLEFCSTSLDHLFLPESDPKKYKGPMPSHEQVFVQLVSGLQYIHEKKLVHGSIKPSNVLIDASEDPHIKLADFGFRLIAPRWDNINSISLNSSDTLVSGFQSEQYWLAPELKIVGKENETAILKPTIKSDIFSTGKVFLYYCNLFYAELILNEIALNNMSEGNQEYVFKTLPIMGNFVKENKNENNNNYSPIQLINEMTKEDPDKRLQLKNVFECVKSFEMTSKGKLEKMKDSLSGDIQFSREFILGAGNQGNVYLGLWKGSIAAVKRIIIQKSAQEEELQKLDHCNIVKFYGFGRDSDFICIAMEKCLTSLDAYCRQPQLFHGLILMPSDKQVLLQMVTGLQYIHSQNLIHRDVKPENILLSGDKPAVIKWTDFGMSKRLTNTDGTVWSGIKGTKGWMSPEVVNHSDQVIAGVKSDIFSLGCVFFFFITPTIHPFGNNSNERKINIKSQNKPNLIVPNPTNLTVAFTSIIEGMIEFDPTARTELTKVMEDLNAV